jgi:hypothetical protein
MKAIRILVLTACVLVTHSLPAQMQEGWSDPSIAAATEDCTQFFIARPRGNLRAEPKYRVILRLGLPFLKRSCANRFEPLCGCIVDRAAASWPLAEWQANFEAHFAPMFQEAMAGGQCKPHCRLSGRSAQTLGRWHF